MIKATAAQWLGLLPTLCRIWEAAFSMRTIRSSNVAGVTPIGKEAQHLGVERLGTLPHRSVPSVRQHEQLCARHALHDVTPERQRGDGVMRTPDDDRGSDDAPHMRLPVGLQRYDGLQIRTRADWEYMEYISPSLLPLMPYREISSGSPL
jgi:hypothetical protein